MQATVIYPADFPHKPEPRTYEYEAKADNVKDALDEIWREFNRVDGHEFISTEGIEDRSMMVGDVVLIEDEHYVCAPMGWKKLNPNAMEDWINNTLGTDRSFLIPGLYNAEFEVIPPDGWVPESRQAPAN